MAAPHRADPQPAVVGGGQDQITPAGAATGGEVDGPGIVHLAGPDPQFPRPVGQRADLLAGRGQQQGPFPGFLIRPPARDGILERAHGGPAADAALGEARATYKESGWDDPGDVPAWAGATAL